MVAHARYNLRGVFLSEMRDDTAEHETRRVSTPAELLTALEDNTIDTVVVNATLTSVPSFVLPPTDPSKVRARMRGFSLRLVQTALS
jgi:hypothetical protein